MLPIALLVVAALAAFGHLLQPGRVPYSDHSDLVACHLGVKWAAYRSIRAGEGLPFWRSDQFSGSPALTNPQAMYANPLHILFDVIDPATAAGPTLWIEFAAMGLGMYLWGASMGLGTGGRLFMAVAGMLNFKLIAAAYAGWLPVISALTMCPFLLAAVIYVLRRPGAASTAVLAAVGAPFLVSGHPQFVYYSLLLAASCVAAFALQGAWRRQWPVLRRPAISLASAAFLAVGIASPLLISFVADRQLVTRSAADYAFFLGPHCLQPRHLLTFLYPEWLGTTLKNSCAHGELWEDVAYFGLVPLALALIGAVGGWSRPFTRWLTAATAACILLAADTPVGRCLFDLLPGYALFRLPNRFLFYVSLLGIALSGFGAEELLTRWRARCARRGRKHEWLAVAVFAGTLLAMTLEGAYYARRYITMLPRRAVVPQTAYAAFFARDPAPFRIAPGLRDVINYGWAGPMNLQLIAGYDPWNFRHYQAYFWMMEGLALSAADSWQWADFIGVGRPDMLDALNVKYIVSRTVRPLPADRYPLVARFQDQPAYTMYTGLGRENVFVYRNRTCLPRAFWVDRVVRVADDRTMSREAGETDLRRAAVVMAPGDSPSDSVPDRRDSATVRAARAGSLTVATSSVNRRYLVVSEIWHPGCAPPPTACRLSFAARTLR